MTPRNTPAAIANEEACFRRFKNSYRQIIRMARKSAVNKYLPLNSPISIIITKTVADMARCFFEFIDYYNGLNYAFISKV